MSVFESSNPMRYKKEGDIYYFYPHLTLALGVYCVCAAQTKQAAAECAQSAFIHDGGTPTVTVKILGKDAPAPLKLYEKVWVPTGGPGSCGNSGSVSINQLEFI